MNKSQNNSETNDKKRKLRNDIILAAVIILIAVAGLLIFSLNKEEGAYATVFINGKETAAYPLSKDTEVVITSGAENENTNTLVIKDGKAYVSDADCPDKICVDTRAASYVGETIVCLPHKLVIEITADNAEQQFDVAV